VHRFHVFVGDASHKPTVFKSIIDLLIELLQGCRCSLIIHAPAQKV
jgi:hypothetical protein